MTNSRGSASCVRKLHCKAYESFNAQDSDNDELCPLRRLTRRRFVNTTRTTAEQFIHCTGHNDLREINANTARNNRTAHRGSLDNLHISTSSLIAANLQSQSITLPLSHIYPQNPDSMWPPTGSATMRATYGPWAIVTGASSGLGVEFARQLAAHGLHIAVVARRKTRLENLCASINATTEGRVQTLAIEADLSTEDGVSHVIQSCANIDVGLLVNNAGMAVKGSFFAADAGSLSQLIDVNVRAVARLTHAFGRKMCERRRGGIMFISSVSSHGFPWLCAYSASKSFVSTLGTTLHQELAHYNVHCLVVEPGFVKTEMTVGDDGDASSFGGWMMNADRCVQLSLQVLGRRGLLVPSWTYAVVRRLLMVLPRQWTFALLGWMISRWVGPFPLDGESAPVEKKGNADTTDVDFAVQKSVSSDH